MLKHILSCLGTYKKYAILAPLIISIEVCMEILMPLVMAKIIDNGIGNGDIHYVAKNGVVNDRYGLYLVNSRCIGRPFCRSSRLRIVKRNPPETFL